jgi:selenocysteine lyase/cysteine desulfurase
MCYVDLVVAIAEPGTSAFLHAYPSYASTQALDELRTKEYPALASHTYLDFTAANLYATSQVARHLELLQHQLLGNPHSTNPSSTVATGYVARARRAVLRFFNASPDEWEIVFAGNASQALKLIGESYPFSQGDRFLLTFDNHN